MGKLLPCSYAVLVPLSCIVNLSDDVRWCCTDMTAVEGLPYFQTCVICKHWYADPDLESISHFRTPVGLVCP